MYLPSHFEETRVDVLHALLRERPLGLLITTAADGPVADPVPFLLQPGPTPLGTLVGHVARANPLWRGAVDPAAAAAPVLVVFQGPQGYVSPGWYPSKAETGKVVPTWNYVVAQARGRLHAIDDVAAVREVVTRLTALHESGLRRPWSIDDAPGDFIDSMLRAIVRIEIPIDTLTGKWKLSQNRNPADRDAVVQALRDSGDPFKVELGDWVLAARTGGAT